MKKSSHSLLWQKLQTSGLVTGEEPEFNNDGSPWYVRTMLGIAGWVGAILLLGALFGGFALLINSAFAAGMFGAGACLVAVIMYRTSNHNDFAEQFAFAVSLAGQALMVYSIMKGLNLFSDTQVFISKVRQLALVLLALQSVLFILVPNYLHRNWSALIGVGAAVFLLNQYGLYPFTLAITLAAGVTLWLQEFHWAKYGQMLRALGYSLVIISISHLLTQNHFWDDGRFWQNVFGIQPLGGAVGEWIASLCLGLVLIGLVVALLKRGGIAAGSRVYIASLVLALLVAAIGLQAPGITVGIVVVLLGYSRGNTILTGLGLVTLVVFVSQFYYLLHLTLLEKSVLLVVSGLALLAVRQVLKHYWPKGAADA